MALFNDISKKVGDAAKTAAKKSGDLLEITKLNSSISGEENEINSLYKKIGFLYYQANRELADDLPEDYRELFVKVEERNSNIELFKQKIYEIKNVMICTSCGKELPLGTAFCNHCGANLKKKCPACAAALEDDSKFCVSCGHKIGQDEEEVNS